jgi:protein-S-isoprenylcysteine O-methyltransferase Ste14
MAHESEPVAPSHSAQDAAHRAEPVAPRDVCARNAATAKAAIVAVLLAAVVLLLPPVKTLFAFAGKFAPGFIAVAIVFPAMIICELLLFKPHRQYFDFTAKRTLGFAAKQRMFLKFFVHLVCLLLLGAFYAAATFIKDTFLILYCLLFPILLLLPVIYFWVTEKYGKEDALDEFVIAGNSLTDWLRTRSLPPEKRAPSPLRNSHTCNLLRTYFVKGFFVPFMTFACCTAWLFWQEKGTMLFSHAWFINPAADAVAVDMGLIYEALIPLIVAADVTVGTAGYITSTRIMGTHIIRTDPTVLGWIVALICYPPFDKLFDLGKLLPVENIWPQDFARAFPIASIICCIVTLLLWSGYTWATFTFGLRFSNLTNRGTIDFGPYAVIRHPAYAMKTFCWWVTLIPVFVLHQQSLVYAIPALAVITIIYILRAITEERNMSVDPQYLEYKKKVRWRFIPFIW